MKLPEESGDDQVELHGSDDPIRVNEKEEIGKGKSWRDIYYKILRTLTYSKFGRKMPGGIRDLAISQINNLLQYDTIERYRTNEDYDFHKFEVPPGEHVRMPSLWLVELFPPSELANLMKAIEKNSWDRYRVKIRPGDANREILERSRTGRGPTWWRLAEIYGESKNYNIFPDGVKRKLPEEFLAIELLAIQIGSGLTAVLAHFHLNDSVSEYLDEIWHSDQNPEIVRGKGYARAESSTWVKYRKTQSARRSVHDLAQSWMRSMCPGFFASNNGRHPVVDLLLMDKFDPTGGKDQSQSLRSALRALGLTEHDTYQRVSENLRGLVLDPVSVTISPALQGERTWAIWGNSDVVAGHLRDAEMQGSETGRVIGGVVLKRARNFFILMAVSEMLDIMRENYADLRDSARGRHGDFKNKSIKLLRSSFLTLSLDLSSVARDMRGFHNPRWRYDSDADFYIHEIFWVDGDPDFKKAEPISMGEILKERQSEDFEELTSADKDYRDILSTVASLGASADTFRLSRVAIWISLASLVIACVTLTISDIKPEAPLMRFIKWTIDILVNA